MQIKKFWEKKRCVILMYHLISEPKDEKETRYACPPVLFSKHMEYLLSAGYKFISLSEVISYINHKKEFPRKAISITLDDGFRNNYDYAFPILLRYKIPATIFLIADYIDHTNLWMKKDGYPDRFLLNWEQIREMQAQGIEFGGHTCTHPRLTKLDEEDVKREIRDCKKIIERNLGKEVIHFAYPYGLFSDFIKHLVKEYGFKTACSIVSGFNNEMTDPFILRRIEVKGTDSVSLLQRKVRYGTNDSHWAFPMKNFVERVSVKISRKVYKIYGT